MSGTWPEEDYLDESIGLGGDPVLVTEALAMRLATVGIEVLDGCLAYNRTFTVKPALLGPRDSPRVPVIIKLYNSTHRQRLADVPQSASARRESQRRAAVTDDEVGEYAREMNILAGSEMRHPHLLRVLAFSKVPRDWICCEMFEMNLFDYIRQNKAENGGWTACASLFYNVLVPVASAVEFLHQKKYVHKDINSKHVLLQRDLSRVVLAGHKLSKHHDVDGLLSSAKRGEIHWMDPLCFEHTYVFHNDVYSLGVILGELLTGGAPFNMDPQGMVVKKLLAGASPHVINAEVENRWCRMTQLFYDTIGEEASARPDAKQFRKEVNAATKEDDRQVAYAVHVEEHERHSVFGTEIARQGCVVQ
jgi:serine/threonine protein kinase